MPKVVPRALTEEEIAERKAEAQSNAIENRLAFYSKAFKDVIFYEDENNCMILSTPDTKGKGQGVIGELSGLLPTFYDFHYAIELENMNEKKSVARWTNMMHILLLKLTEKTILQDKRQFGNSSWRKRY